MVLLFPCRDDFNSSIAAVTDTCFRAAFLGESSDAALVRGLPALAASACLPTPATRDAMACIDGARSWLEDARVAAAAECLGKPWDDIVAPLALTRAVELAAVICDLDAASNTLRLATLPDLGDIK